MVALGDAELVDGEDESYFHARVVELCDGLRARAPSADVTLVLIGPGRRGRGGEPDDRRQAFNAAVTVTAELRGFAWCPVG